MTESESATCPPSVTIRPIGFSAIPSEPSAFGDAADIADIEVPTATTTASHHTDNLRDLVIILAFIGRSLYRLQTAVQNER